MGKVAISIFSAVLSVAGVLLACQKAAVDVKNAGQVVKNFRNA